jgi:ketosteroid isomerase-like protein
MVGGKKWWIFSLLVEQNLRGTETVLNMETGQALRAERWRWILYVALAIAGGLLTFVGARAQQKATDDATFRKLIDNYCAAWSTGNADSPARFYAQEDGLVFYDIAPFAYHGWKEYHDGVKKEFFDNMASGTLTAGNDLKVRRHGTVAWTTVSMHFSEKTKDGKTTETEIRYTGIWEHRPAGWVIVHEHLSAPLGGN